MKGLLSTRASRAWMVVALVGLVVVVLVLALRLVPRLGSGQELIDAAEPALTDERVAGDRAGIDFISKYVDLADPLMTPRGGGSREVATLVRLLARRTDLSTREVAAVLRREAPHTEALLRSLPLSGVAREVPALTSYLATTLNLSEEGLAAQLEQSFPKISQTLTALSGVASGWNDVPGLNGMTRFDGATEVRTVPQLRGYFSQDLVATVESGKDDFQDVAGSGGIGYIPWLLLVVGGALLLLGLLQARRGAKRAPGRLGWTLVSVVAIVILALVGGAQYVPRLNAADRLVDDLAPAFEQSRVEGARAGVDMVHQAVRFGDPIATKRGGAAGEVPQLVGFVARQTNVSRGRVLASLRRQAPRITAVLQAIPLSSVAAEVPHLLTYLQRRLKVTRAELVSLLEARTPNLAQAILSVRPVAIRWNSIPGTEDLTRFDGQAVRTMPELDQYLGQDVIPVLENERESFGDLADPWPPLNYFPPLLIGVGVLLLLYSLLMRRFATS